MTEARIPIVLCVDVEPDERLVDRRRAADWAGFEKLFARFNTLRQRLADRYGVAIRVSWSLRMDPQIRDTYGDASWAAEHYAQPIAEALRWGDEIGLHVHAYRWDDSLGNWVADHGNEDWVDVCIRTSAGAFRNAFGCDCVSYRMGDRFINERTLELMESLGGVVDLTAEPGWAPSPAVYIEQPYTGSLPELRGVPRRAYRPSRSDFRRPDASGERAISIVPVTTWKLPVVLAAARRAYAFVQDLRKAPVPDVLRRQRVMTFGLSLPPLYFRRVLDGVLSDDSVAHLVSTDRSHIGSEPQKLDRIETNLGVLLAHPMAHRFAFARSSEVMDILAGPTAHPSPLAAAAAI